ncbi:hypothetical protein CK203_080952 [Vitis vinifera]|uniref:Uncharacterized protein n=1 Tax=Vitis vinifera TaxID=29760 RepID=A0A438EMV5_VITVI|nr:hypothetical protein CK203_080952 [Vitis vinifera]
MKKALHVEFDEVPHVGFIGKLKIRSVCNTYIRSKSMASRLFLTTAKTPVTPKYHCLIGQIRNHISITPTHIGQVTTEFEHGSSSSSSERSSKDTDMQADTIRIQWSFNNLSRRCRATRLSQTSYPECAILSGGKLVLFQRHHGAHMATWHEGHHFHVSPKGKLPD